jgi:hypothetical protein
LPTEYPSSSVHRREKVTEEDLQKVLADTHCALFTKKERKYFETTGRVDPDISKSKGYPAFKDISKKDLEQAEIYWADDEDNVFEHKNWRHREESLSPLDCDTFIPEQRAVFFSPSPIQEDSSSSQSSSDPAASSSTPASSQELLETGRNIIYNRLGDIDSIYKLGLNHVNGITPELALAIKDQLKAYANILASKPGGYKKFNHSGEPNPFDDPIRTNRELGRIQEVRSRITHKKQRN